MKQRILITEDDRVQREIISDILLKYGYIVKGVGSAQEALESLAAETYDLVLTDMRMPGMDGLELLRQIKRVRPETEVVIMTAFATVQTAVTAMKEGAIDYLAKPFDKDQLLIVVTRAMEGANMRRENRQLREMITTSVSTGNIIGDAPAMRRVKAILDKAVRVNSTVLIQGESGTGKELVARHLHFCGARAEKPFVPVNCAAIPDTLVESELFGHDKGAFTGADKARQGKFELADGGTLFLDEIGDMPLDSQAKLLRVLQDGMVERIGSSQAVKVDVRVICATNRNLAQLVQDRTFREDLYFRLDVLGIPLPPLRERMEDLPLLIAHFREKLGQRLGRTVPNLAPPVVDAMRRYRWPGNVRELENTLEQMFILCDGATVQVADLPDKFQSLSQESSPFALPPGGLVLEDLEQDLIRQALDRSGGRIKDAAELLGLTYKTLQYRLKKHEIDRHGPADDEGE